MKILVSNFRPFSSFLKAKPCSPQKCSCLSTAEWSIPMLEKKKRKENPKGSYTRCEIRSMIQIQVHEVYRCGVMPSSLRCTASKANGAQSKVSKPQSSKFIIIHHKCSLCLVVVLCQLLDKRPLLFLPINSSLVSIDNKLEWQYFHSLDWITGKSAKQVFIRKRCHFFQLWRKNWQVNLFHNCQP